MAPSQFESWLEGEVSQNFYTCDFSLEVLTKRKQTFKINDIVRR